MRPLGVPFTSGFQFHDLFQESRGMGGLVGESLTEMPASCTRVPQMDTGFWILIPSPSNGQLERQQLIIQVAEFLTPW